jgi:hypothetical protein
VLYKQVAEALGELVFGDRDPSVADPTPVTLLTNPERLAKLKAELQEKLLQIQESERRARQDSNLRPSDS